MRRWLATVLTAISGLAPLTPLLAASGADSSLPQCCRKDGKHHCAMPSDLSSGPALGGGRCGQFPVAQATPSVRLALAGSPQGFTAAPLIRAQVAHPSDAPRHQPFDRAGQKRGPPAYFS